MKRVYPVIVEIRSEDGRLLSREPIEMRSTHTLVSHIQSIAKRCMQKMEEEPIQPPLVLIEHIALNDRGKRALMRRGFRTLGQVMVMTETQLLGIAGFGKASLDELKAVLEKYHTYIEIGG